MAHDILLGKQAQGRDPVGVKAALIGILLAIIAAISLSGSETPRTSETQAGAPVAEDWHGNVRRSYGVY